MRLEHKGSANGSSLAPRSRSMPPMAVQLSGPSRLTACQLRLSAHESFRLTCGDVASHGAHGPANPVGDEGPWPSARSRMSAIRRPDRGGDEFYHGPRADGW